MIQEQASEQQRRPTVIENLVLTLFKRLSVCLIVFGRRGSGKTDFALLVAEILAKFNEVEHFATNVKIYNSPFIIQRIDNLEDLEDWASSLQGRKLFILDEAGKTLRRRTPMSKLNVEWLDNLQILRKHKLSIIMAVPAEKYIDSATLGSDVLDAVVLKPNFKNPKIAYYEDKLEGYSTRLYDIPRTVVKFDTWDVAVFKKSGVKKKPKFKTKEKEIAWEWAHGKTHKDLGLYPMQIHRIIKKVLKVLLEEQLNT